MAGPNIGRDIGMDFNVRAMAKCLQTLNRIVHEGSMQLGRRLVGERRDKPGFYASRNRRFGEEDQHRPHGKIVN